MKRSITLERIIFSCFSHGIKYGIDKKIPIFSICYIRFFINCLRKSFYYNLACLLKHIKLKWRIKTAKGIVFGLNSEITNPEWFSWNVIFNMPFPQSSQNAFNNIIIMKVFDTGSYGIISLYTLYFKIGVFKKFFERNISEWKELHVFGILSKVSEKHNFLYWYWNRTIKYFLNTYSWNILFIESGSSENFLLDLFNNSTSLLVNPISAIMNPQFRKMRIKAFCSDFRFILRRN